MTFNTGNNVPSTDPRDLYDNAENLDKLVNGADPFYADRKGVLRESWAGMENSFNNAQEGRENTFTLSQADKESRFQAFLVSAGYVSKGDYAADVVLLERNEYVAVDAATTGTTAGLYRPNAEAVLPLTLTGTWATDAANLVLLGDDVLRQELASEAGSELVGHGSGTVGSALGSLNTRIESAEVAVSELQLAASKYVRPQDFGAIGDGVADDTAALLACLSDGRPVYLGDDSINYRITSEVSFTAARAVFIQSNGARVTVDSAASIRSAIRIDLAGKGLYLSGRLFLDCQLKSFTGFYATNYGAGRPKVDALVSGLEVSNCFRANTSIAGGDGIWIGGNLNKLRIVDCSARNIRMAAGAGVELSQGVCGITVARDTANSLDASLTVIDGCEIGPVYCDDVNYKLDQDGVRVFTAYTSEGDTPRPTQTVVQNCRFINCHGRAIKIQTEYSVISNIKIERTSAIHGSGYIGNPDIDLQVGGGLISNIQCYYSSNFPSRVILASLTRTDTRLNPTAVNISGLIISQVGSGAGIERVISCSTDFDATALLTLSGVSLHGTKVPSYMMAVQSQVAEGSWMININGMAGRASVAFVGRLGSALTNTYVTGCAIQNFGTTIPFATATTAGGLTSALVGVNRLVT